MSKSKGNVVDPLDLVNEYGTDALRFTLASLVGAGRDIRFSEDRLDGYKNFINKIWNATRFCLGALKDVPVKNISDLKTSDLSLPDLFIINELQKTVEDVTLALDEYRFTDAANSLYKFTWNELCDWYLELSKPVLYGSNMATKGVTGAVLYSVLERLIRLLHPFIPFITEEIYHLLPAHGESLCIAPFPNSKDALFSLGAPQKAQQMESIKAVVSAIRNIRGENRISPAVKIKFKIEAQGKILESLKSNDSFILSLARAEEVEYSQSASDTKKSAISLITLGTDRISIVVPLEGLVDFNEEIKRLNKEIEKIEKDLALAQKKLGTETFMKNAPEEIIQQEKLRLSQLTDKKNHVLTQIQRLQ